MTKKITELTASEYVNATSKEYAIYTCTTRAIPSVCDGLKDSQRKALWLLRNKTDKIKTIALAGEMISSNLYVHGDTSAADAISKLAAPYLNNVPLISGIGAFGTRVSPTDGIAAPRYTYVRKSSLTEQLVYNDLNIVPLKENYDGSAMEPQTFLPIIPLVLLNGVRGVAVGWSTTILPRSAKDIIKQTKNAVLGKPVEDIMPSYDFLETIIEKTDDRKYTAHGKLQYIDTSTVRIIELPPNDNLEQYKAKLNDMEEKEIIHSYIDNSSKNIDIHVKFKRGSVKKEQLDAIAGVLKLSNKLSEDIVVLDWGSDTIRRYESTVELIKDFVEWRKSWYVTRYEKKLADASYELNFWKGVKACFKGKLPSKLQALKSKTELLDLITSLTTNLSPSQIDNIASFASYRWVKEYEDVVDANITKLEAEIIDYTDTIASDDKRNKIYVAELDQLAKMTK